MFGIHKLITELRYLMATIADLQSSVDKLTAAVKARNDAPPPPVEIPQGIIEQIDAATTAISIDQASLGAVTAAIAAATPPTA